MWMNLSSTVLSEKVSLKKLYMVYTFFIKYTTEIKTLKEDVKTVERSFSVSKKAVEPLAVNITKEAGGKSNMGIT